MEKKKINLSTILLIISLIIIIIMGFFIYKLYNDKQSADNQLKILNDKVAELQNKVDNFKNGGIYTREFKTNKEQAFDLHPSLVKDIESYINRNELVEGEYLFKSRKGTNKPITRQRAWQIIKELAEDVKISYVVGCHSLRKYFARQYYEKTGDLIGLSEMLNHSSETVTLRYICWDKEDKLEKRKNFYLG